MPRFIHYGDLSPNFNEPASWLDEHKPQPGDVVYDTYRCEISTIKSEDIQARDEYGNAPIELYEDRIFVARVNINGTFTMYHATEREASLGVSYALMVKNDELTKGEWTALEGKKVWEPEIAEAIFPILVRWYGLTAST